MSDIDTVKQAAAVKAEVDGLHMQPADFFMLIWDGSWVKLADPKRSEFVQRFTELAKGTATLAEKFNATVWAGHVDGSVPESIAPLRKARTGEKGGPKPAPKTMAQLLLKK